MTDIATDLRAECARILARNFGLPNELAAIKISTVARIDAYVTHAEDRAAACTCQPVPVFQITARHNAAPYRILEEIAIERMQGRS